MEGAASLGHASVTAERQETKQNCCLLIKVFAWKEHISFLSHLLAEASHMDKSNVNGMGIMVLLKDRSNKEGP